MSGFTTRRFVLQNITAVAAHCPIPVVSNTAFNILHRDAGVSRTAEPEKKSMLSWLISSAKSKNTTNFTLITEAELEWIRKRREEDADESRVILSCRPHRSLVWGMGGAVLDGVIACLVSPLVFLAIMLERMRHSSNIMMFCLAPVYSTFWTSLFFVFCFYAGAQQLLLSFYYGWCATPYFYLANKLSKSSSGEMNTHALLWNILSCKFDAPIGRLGQKHELLQNFYSSDAAIRERGMKRMSNRDSKKETATYKGRKGGPSGENNYYELLGVKSSATDKEIKEAYNKLVLKIHPDRNPSPDAAQQFDQVTKAYRVLSNPAKRKKYDIGGTKGVEDLGVKKREAVRALFGGEMVYALCGDVFTGSFSMRVIDGIDVTAEEIAVLKQRMYERCRDELLENYVQKYIEYSAKSPASDISSESNKKERVNVNTPNSAKWENYMSMKIRKLTTTGLAKEVLFVLGNEYKRAVEYFDSQFNLEGGSTQSTDVARGNMNVSSVSIATRRLNLYFSSTLPHRMTQRRLKVKHLLSTRKDTFKNSEAMIDLAWYTSVEELERTARLTALTILYDPSLSLEEAQLRRDGLAELGKLFVQYGQVYKGANRTTLNQLMDSMREYQQQQQRAKDEA